MAKCDTIKMIEFCALSKCFGLKTVRRKLRTRKQFCKVITSRKSQLSETCSKEKEDERSFFEEF